MAVHPERLKSLLRVLVQGLSRALPSDAIQDLHQEIDALEDDVEQPVDPYEGLTDQELLAKAQAGDTEALNRFVARRDAPAVVAAAPEPVEAKPAAPVTNPQGGWSPPG
jgi:hypothetical protein